MHDQDPTPPSQMTATWPFGHNSPVIGSTPMTIAAPTPTPPRRRGRRLLAGLAALAGFAIVVATAAGVSYVVADRTTGSTLETPATTTPAPTQVAAAPTTSTAPPISVGMDFTDEPFARAAALVGPAVVQLDTGTGLGSGVIYDSSGLILTAAHVVDNVDTVIVRLADGSSVQGEVVGSHALSDIGVVRINVDRELPFAVLANGSETAVGQLAVAVGSPFGLDQTVTAGIVSATHRILSNGPNNVPMVQTDAAINPGNSGGPLVNLAGEVIGINSQIFTESGENSGVGFAVTIELAKLVASQIVAGEDVQLALLGVSTTSTLDGTPGALIQEVLDDSAAYLSGLQSGDVVIFIDGQPIRGSSDLRAAVLVRKPDSTSTLTVIRDGEQVSLSVTFGRTG